MNVQNCIPLHLKIKLKYLQLKTLYKSEVSSMYSYLEKKKNYND